MTNTEHIPDDTPDEDFIFELDEISPLTEAILHLDHAQLNANRTLQMYYIQEPTPEISLQLNMAYKQVLAFYDSCLRAIENEQDTDTDTKIKMITTLTINESRTRIDAFEELYPDNKKLFKPYRTKDVLREIEHVYERHDSEKKRRKNLNQLFSGSLQAQLTEMVEVKHALPRLVQDVPEEQETFAVEPTQERHETLRLIGSYALDIAKIGIGVASGIIAATLITRRRS